MENTVQNQDYPMTPEMVAEYLHKSPRTVRYWMKNKMLVGRRIGGAWFIMKSDLDRQLRRGA